MALREGAVQVLADVTGLGTLLRHKIREAVFGALEHLCDFAVCDPVPLPRLRVHSPGQDRHFGLLINQLPTVDLARAHQICQVVLASEEPGECSGNA